MTVNGNSVNIAAMGPGHRLKFYWAVNGTSTWHPETVAGASSTFSAPSPGYPAAFDIIDAVLRQLSGDAVDYPTKRGTVVHGVIDVQP